MRGLRTLLSAIAILAGAALLVAWAISAVMMRAVEDGAAVEVAVERAMDSPVVVDRISSHLQDAAITGLEERGVDATGWGLDGVVRDAVDDAVHSPAFREAVVDQAGAAHAQIADQLTEPDRDPAPLTVSVDVNTLVQQRIGDAVPGVTTVPALGLPPVTVEAMSAEAFEQVRGTYDMAESLHRWAGWAGAALVLLGFLVSARRRWFVAKAALAIGVLSLGLWMLVEVVGPDWLTDRLPGAQDWGRLVSEEIADAVAGRALWVGLVALAVAGVAGLLASLMRKRTGGGRR